MGGVRFGSNAASSDSFVHLLDARAHVGGCNLAPRIFVSLIILVTFIRLFLGIDFSDESYYVASAWALVLDGGRVFHSDLFVAGIAGLFASPFLWLYSLVFGTEASILFFRLLYFVLATVTFLAGFGYFRKRMEDGTAVLVASLSLAYIPFSVPSFCYNTVVALGTPLSVFLLLSGTKWKAIAAGLVGAIVSFSYPPMAVVFLGIFAWQTVRQREFKFASSITGFGLLFITWAVFTGLENFGKVLEISSHLPFLGGFEKLRGAAELFVDGLLFKQRVAAHLATAWMVYAPLFLFLAAFVLRIRVRLDFPLVIGLATGLVAGYSSSNILINCSLGFVLASQALLAQICARRRWGNVALAFLLIAICVTNFTSFYRESELSALNSRVTSGPFRFLWTTSARAQFLGELDEDLKSVAKDHSSIFAVDLPSAYLHTSMRPVTGMLFTMERPFEAAVVKLALHRTIERNEWPEVVIVRVSPNTTFENAFRSAGRYRMTLERPSYRVWTIVAPP